MWTYLAYTWLLSVDANGDLPAANESASRRHATHGRHLSRPTVRTTASYCSPVGWVELGLHQVQV